MESDRIYTPPASVNVQVSIPVALGGYTGPVAQWEEQEGQWKVSGDRSEVVLEEQRGSLRRKIAFSVNDLEAALRFLGQTKPVMRSATPDTGQHSHG
jgi:hypothetical protein